MIFIAFFKIQTFLNLIIFYIRLVLPHYLRRRDEVQIKNGRKRRQNHGAFTSENTLKFSLGLLI